MVSYPSIFNDVLGPVMRGPSSSHSAASLRIGRMALDLMDSDIKSVTVDYDPNGSLVTTHLSQGSDLGLTGGILGWETDDPRLPNYRDEVIKAGIDIEVRYLDYGAEHPNTYQLTLRGNQKEHAMTAISTGGGMIEVQKIDDIPVNMKGDYYEIVIFLKNPDAGLSAWLSKDNNFDEVVFVEGEKKSLINLKSREAPTKNLIEELSSYSSVIELRILKPVLPVLARKNLKVPFSSVQEMEEYRNEYGEMSLGELGAIYESERSGLSINEVRDRMSSLIKTMEDSIQTGLKGTHYRDRILHSQSPRFGDKMESGDLIPGDVLNRIILYVSSMMEMKSSMGVIVAAPTAGSCGALPGAVLGVSDALNKNMDDVLGNSYKVNACTRKVLMRGRKKFLKGLTDLRSLLEQHDLDHFFEKLVNDAGVIEPRNIYDLLNLDNSKLKDLGIQMLWKNRFERVREELDLSDYKFFLHLE